MERLQSQPAEVWPVPSRSARLTGSKELPVTKEQIDGLAKSLDELRLGMEDVDRTHALQAMQGDALLTSAICVLLRRIPHLILSSAMGRMEDKLRDIADRIENMGSTGSGNEKVLSELVDEIRAVVSILRVSSNSRAALLTWIANQFSLLRLHPPHLANYLHQHRRSSSDATNWLRRSLTIHNASHRLL